MSHPRGRGGTRCSPWLCTLCGLVLASFATITGAQSQDPFELDLSVIARIDRANGTSTFLDVQDGAVLRSGDGVQVRVRTRTDAYVYVLAYGSSGTAVLLHPFSGDHGEARVVGGEETIIPGPDAFLPLDGQTGREGIFALASDVPISDLTRLLLRMEGHGTDVTGVSQEVRRLHPDAQQVAFRHIGAEPLEGLGLNLPSNTSGGSATDIGTLFGNAGSTQDQPEPHSEAFEQIIADLPTSTVGQSNEDLFAGGYEEPGVLSAEGSRIDGVATDADEPSAIDALFQAATATDQPPPPAADEVLEAEESTGLLGKLGNLFGFGGDEDELPVEPIPEPEPEVTAQTFGLNLATVPVAAPEPVVVLEQILPEDSDSGPVPGVEEVDIVPELLEETVAVIQPVESDSSVSESIGDDGVEVVAVGTEVPSPTASALGEGTPLDGVTVVGVHESEAVLWLADEGSQNAVAAADREPAGGESASDSTSEQDPSEVSRLQGVLSRWLSLPNADDDSDGAVLAASQDEVPQTIEAGQEASDATLTAAATAVQAEVDEQRVPEPAEDEVVSEAGDEDTGLLSTISNWLKPVANDSADQVSPDPEMAEVTEVALEAAEPTAVVEEDVVAEPPPAPSPSVIVEIAAEPDIVEIDVAPAEVSEASILDEDELAELEFRQVESADVAPSTETVEPESGAQSSSLLATLSAWLKPEPGDNAVADEGLFPTSAATNTENGDAIEPESESESESESDSVLVDADPAESTAAELLVETGTDASAANVGDPDAAVDEDDAAAGADAQLDGGALAALAEMVRNFEEPVFAEEEPADAPAIEPAVVESDPIEVGSVEPEVETGAESVVEEESTAAFEEVSSDVDVAAETESADLLNTLSTWLGGDTHDQSEVMEAEAVVATEEVAVDELPAGDLIEEEAPLPDAIVLPDEEPTEVAASSDEPTEQESTGVVSTLFGWLAADSQPEDSDANSDVSENGAADEPSLESVAVEDRAAVRVAAPEPEPEPVEIVELQVIEPEVDVLADEVPSSEPATESSSGQGLTSLFGWLSGGQDSEESETSESGSEVALATASESNVVESPEAPESAQSAQSAQSASEPEIALLPVPGDDNEPTVAADESQASEGGGLFGALGSLFTLGGNDDVAEPVEDTAISLVEESLRDDEPAAFQRISDDDGERVLIVQGTGEAPATSAVNQGESEGVLEAAGSRIKALLTGGSQPSADGSADSAATSKSTLAASEANSEVTLTASAESVPESSLEVSEQVAAGDGSAAVGEADTKADTGLAAPRVEPDPVQNLLALADPDSTTTLEDLGAAIKSVTQPIASIDVLDDSSVAAGVVLLVTPTSTGSAIIVDRQGHVLANWHVVEGYSRVTLLLKEPSGNGASYQGVYSAEVLKVSRFADLALLKINEPPDDLHVIPLAAHGDLDKGDIVHSVSHPADRLWTHTVGKVVRSRERASWYSGNKILHRAAIVDAKLLEAPGVSGSALFNNRLELVGIGAQWSNNKEQVTAISVNTIRQFLFEEPAAQAVASGGS